MRLYHILIALVLAGCQSSPESSHEYPPYIKGAALESRDMEERVIVFFGSDITAGYGLNTEEAFPDLIRNRIDSSYLPFAVVNAGVKSDSSRSGLNRVSYLLNENVDVFVLTLGFTDAREMRNPGQIRANLQTMLEKVRSQSPSSIFVIANVILPSYDPVYAQQLTVSMKELAAVNEAEYIPSLLEGIAGVKEYTQADLINPNAKGQVLVADKMWKVLKPILKDLYQQDMHSSQAAAIR